MKNKVIPALLIIVTATAVFLLVQHIRLKTELNTTPVTTPQVKIAPVVPDTRPANPPGASPFDKPNNDPKADEFKPNMVGPDKITSVRFENNKYDFGRVNEGDVVHTQFKFTNTGQWALLVAGVQTSCGCTVPNWPREPIQTGASGVIDISFDSKGKHGETKKTISVVTNTKPNITDLVITATVIPHN